MNNKFIGSLELRYDENDELDEIVGHAHIHLERMSEDYVWMSLTLPDKRVIHVRFRTMTKVPETSGAKIHYAVDEL